MLHIQTSKNTVSISNISTIYFLNLHVILGQLASWPREVSRLEAVLHEVEVKTHEAKAEAKPHEAKARFIDLEASPRDLTSLSRTKPILGLITARF